MARVNSFSLLLYFIEIPVLFHTNTVDPDQIQHFVASDLGLHCLPITEFLLEHPCQGYSNRHKKILFMTKLGTTLNKRDIQINVFLLICARKDTV